MRGEYDLRGADRPGACVLRSVRLSGMPKQAVRGSHTQPVALSWIRVGGEAKFWNRAWPWPVLRCGLHEGGLAEELFWLF